MEDDLHILFKKDDINIFENGRRPKINNATKNNKK
jgi:hypothetical protein